MNLLRLLRVCFRSILRSRMRSLLTSLGIIIGTGSVIVMVALGEGAQRSIEDRLSAMGTNLIQIMPRRQRYGPGQGAGAVPARPNRLTKSDERKLRNESAYALAVSGICQRTFSVAGGDGSWSTTVMGVEPDYLLIRNWNTAEGICFDDEDVAARNRVAVLGATVADKLFGGTETGETAGSGTGAPGRQIRIGNNRFTVIGVLEKKGAGGGGNDQDDVIMVPLDTALTRLVNSRNLSAIAMSVVRKEYMDAARREADLLLREAHRLEDGDAADFEIMNMADIIDMASGTSRTLTTLLAAIAGVSLLVGGIGIMNIMLVSVTERTREIGIRMSVGARRRDILFQFLSESIILSLMGGCIGVILAVSVCRVLALMHIPAVVNPVVTAAAVLFAALVGTGFGYYPARKAAGLYPVDALRYE
ncbi:MAG: ABC transporter permease [Treponema sp.]|jgi:putative ABC transport system permease protein|nr:ABC transporter permease [Treponema sp.]